MSRALLAVGALALVVALSGSPGDGGGMSGGGPTVKLSLAWLAPRIAALKAAWRKVYGGDLPSHAGRLALSVAAVEGAGPVKHHDNLTAWGSVQSRRLSPLERTLLEQGGYKARSCNGSDAQRFLEEQVQAFPDQYAGVGPRTVGNATEFLACDHMRLGDPSSAYWVWFRAFTGAGANAAAAAEMLRRMNARAVLEDFHSTPDELAVRLKATYRYATTPDVYAAALWPYYRGIPDVARASV